MILRTFTQSLIDVFLPKVCLVCERKIDSQDFLCPECQDFERNLSPFCRKCGIGISPELKTSLCFRCRTNRFFFDRNLSPFVFKEPLSKLIHLFKYEGFLFLGNFLSKKLTESLREFHIPWENYHIISSVPLHPRKLKEREFNQSELLAKNISEHFGIPYKETLKLKRYIKAQVGKSAKERAVDIKDNFYIIGEIKSKNIILIDDVFTTGATLSECAKTLKDKGAGEILTITLAIRKIN